MRAPTLVLLLVLTTFPLVPAASASSAPVEVTGPDADGAYILMYDVSLDAPATLETRLDVTRTHDGDVVRAERTLGAESYEAGTTRRAFSFLPAEGPGDYEVALHLGDDIGTPLLFTVDHGAGASARVEFTVADAPTMFRLTSDGVNSDGKLKSPGDALITRAIVEDDNGVADVTAMSYRVVRHGMPAPNVTFSGTIPWTPASNATRQDVEFTFDRAPIAAGSYALTLVAHRDGTAIANVTRTFVIRDVAPALAPDAPLVVRPGEAAPLAFTITDANGLEAGAMLDVRIYRASTRLEDRGYALTFNGGNASTPLSEGQPLAHEAGSARARFDATLVLPSSAPYETIRASVYVNGSFVGARELRVIEPPTLGNVTLVVQDGEVLFSVLGTGRGSLRIMMDAAIYNIPFASGANATFQVPTSESWSWRVELRMREDAPLVAVREGTWASATPDIRVDAPRSAARLPATWHVSAEGWTFENTTATVVVKRWDGVVTAAIIAEQRDGAIRLRGPAHLEPGRYTANAAFEWPNGTRGVVAWSFETGPWLRIDLGVAVVDGRQATLTLSNDGGIALRRIIIETEGPVASLLVDGAPAQETSPGRWRADVEVRPGEHIDIQASLPEGPMRPGRHAVDLRVFAKESVQ